MTAATWWGHSFATVELPGATVVTDPLMSRRLLHLRRFSAPPPHAATACDLVLISHLHHDHLHMRSLRRFDDAVPIVVPRGAVAAVRSLERLNVIEVGIGDHLQVAGVDIEVLRAHHDNRRDKRPGAKTAQAIGFRFAREGVSCWYPGDTADADYTGVDPVDLALVPIGGWGPSLPEVHLDPVQAAHAVGDVGARWTLPLHYGTFWPVGVPTTGPAHDHFFTSPPRRFAEAIGDQGIDTHLISAPFGARVELV